MNVLDLAKEFGLMPKRTASTNGGEYHSSCPNCGGSNRFCIWPEEKLGGRYWCRQCNQNGDAIEFCKKFIGMSFIDACKKVGQEGVSINREAFKLKQKSFSPVNLDKPNEIWRKQALEFVSSSHQSLCQNPNLINLDKDRGLNLQTIKNFKLGWNNDDLFQLRRDWGLSVIPNGSISICLPKGIVIPSFRNDQLIRIKVRRGNWIQSDSYPKYQIVSGGINSPSLYGDPTKPLFLIEAELDAMLVQQMAGDLCSCISLGGVSNKPDIWIHEVLQEAKLVLYSLDFDEAGKKHFHFWKENYKNLKAWPAPKGKSPGDSFLLGIDLRQWVIAGLNR